MKILKIDLHTHPLEALGISRSEEINDKVARKILKAIKLANLDGIAITEHHNFDLSLCLYSRMRKIFPKLIILPGAERDHNPTGQQYLEIFIPDYLRGHLPFFKGKEWFRIFAHPGFYNFFDLDDLERLVKDIGGLDAVEGRSRHGEFKLAEEIHQRLGIPKTQASDAHKLEDLGFYYIEFDFE